MPRKLTTEEFIDKAKALWGDRFDYSQVEYQGGRVPVKIKCNVCGTWKEQTPHDHLSGKGCVVCQHNGNRLSVDAFIKRARSVHGNAYDYSLVQYVNTRTKVFIKCNTCGHVFAQTPQHHFAGGGCPLCSQKARVVRLRELGRKQTLTTDVFIAKAKTVHGNKYDYGLVEYVNAYENVIIKCNTCGYIFEQSPHNHLMGHGCPACAHKFNSGRKIKSESDFLKEAWSVHGDDYDYSETKYIGYSNKVKIKCNTCGYIFWQVAGSHLSGCGCPRCAVRKVQLLRAKNGNGSKSEDTMYFRLCSLFGKDDIERQYYDGVMYPFHCDFYVKSRDMFIELNAFFTHGHHWFDIDSQSDVAIADDLFDKLSFSFMYYSCLDTWMDGENE